MLRAAARAFRLVDRITECWTYALSAAITIAAALLFAAANGSLPAVLAAIALLGFSISSALAGFLLAAATPTGTMLPAQGGYITAALWPLPPLAASVLIIAGTRRTQHPSDERHESPVPLPSSVGPHRQ